MPKITRLETQKKRPGRVNIYLDGKFAFGSSEKMVIDFDLYSGKELSGEDVLKLEAGQNEARCLDSAYRYLSYRPRTEMEVQDKLKEKYSESMITETIGKLKNYHYIDDAEFARMWVNERSGSRSAKALSFELKRKGVSMEIIEAAVAKIDPSQELKNAKELIAGKEKYQNLSREEAYKKIGGFLARRGYNYDIIKKVLEDYK